MRVGYECEVETNKVWKPVILKYGISEDGESGSQYIVTENDESYWYQNNIRVPYLTKEQILKEEGWKKDEILDMNKFQKDIDEKSYYTLSLNDNNQIVITKSFIEGWSWVWSPFYSGECKDINTFRYITKLLGI